MTTYQLGSTIYGAVTVYDSSDELADVGSMDGTWTKPDGSTVAASVSRTSLGQYQGSTTGDQAGRWLLTLTAAGVNSGDFPRTEIVDVWPADPRFIISLADLRDELNVPAGVTVNDDELRLYVAAATAVVESIVGTVLAQTHTETFDGGKAAVLLSERAASITSVTVNGIATTDFVANLASGIVYAGTTSAPRSFQAGRQNVVVTYVAGGNAVDSNVVLAARIIAAHQYQVGQQAKKRDRNTLPEDYALSSSGYAVPRRAMQLLAPSMSGRMPGFA